MEVKFERTARVSQQNRQTFETVPVIELGSWTEIVRPSSIVLSLQFDLYEIENYYMFLSMVPASRQSM